MGKLGIGMNLEAIRRHEKPFEWGVEKAAELGFEYIEPMVHWGRELMSEALYFHTQSMFDDPMDVRDLCKKHGVQCSAISAHCPLGRPDVSVLYLTYYIMRYRPGARVARIPISSPAPPRSLSEAPHIRPRRSATGRRR